MRSNIYIYIYIFHCICFPALQSQRTEPPGSGQPLPPTNLCVGTTTAYTDLCNRKLVVAHIGLRLLKQLCIKSALHSR